MILESLETATAKTEPNTTFGKDLGKLVLAGILFIGFIVISAWFYLQFGSYGKHWYAIYYPAAPPVMGILLMGFLAWLDERFLA